MVARPAGGVLVYLDNILMFVCVCTYIIRVCARVSSGRRISNIKKRLYFYGVISCVHDLRETTSFTYVSVMIPTGCGKDGRRYTSMSRDGF